MLKGFQLLDPDNSESRSLIEQKFKEIIPIIKSKLGETKGRIVEECITPKTPAELRDTLDIHYQTVHDYLTEMRELGLLTRSDKRFKRSYLYLTNMHGVVSYVSSDSFVRAMLQQTNTGSGLIQTANPVESDNLPECPEPTDNVQITVNKTSTTVWKFLLSSYGAPTYKRLIPAAAFTVFYQWHRSYRLATRKESVFDVQGPSSLEAKQTLIALRDEIKGYQQALTKIIEMESFWIESTDLESWRNLGDIPVAVAKMFAEGFMSSWNDKDISTNGINSSVNSDYEEVKKMIDTTFASQYKKPEE